MEQNDIGAVCQWCGEEVETVKKPEYPGERPVGRCDTDGIVYIETPEPEA